MLLPVCLYVDDLCLLSLLCSKLLEEAGELTEAEKTEDVAWEAADVIYFTLVKCAKAGVKLSDVEKIVSILLEYEWVDGCVA